MMTTHNILRLVASAAAMALLAVSPAGPAMAQDSHDHHHEQDTHEEHRVVLAPRDQAEYGIGTQPAGPGLIPRTLDLPAEIHPNDDHLAHIVPRYEGIVTDVLVRVGDTVSEGQTLATIEGDASLAVYPLKTRIAGTVISKHITRGEAVDRGSKPFVIADLDTVWLDMHVFQRDLGKVRVGQRVTVTLDDGSEPATGVISYVSPVVDEVTRTAMARCVLPNLDGRWRPGLFVTAQVAVAEHQVAVAVPEAAVQLVHQELVVFVADEHGYVARPVVAGRTGGGLVEITEGLRPGETIVTAGGFTLKAELEKATFDDGHNH